MFGMAILWDHLHSFDQYNNLFSSLSVYVKHILSKNNVHENMIRKFLQELKEKVIYTSHPEYSDIQGAILSSLDPAVLNEGFHTLRIITYVTF